MKIIKTSKLDAAQKERIHRLWNNEFPRQLAVTPFSFDQFLLTSDHHSHYLIVGKDADLIGWAFTFDRNGERWFSILMDAAFQRKGYGRILLNLLKEKEIQLCGWVIDHPNDLKQNGEPYQSPLSFYRRNGFTPLPDIRMEEDKISALKIVWTK